MAKEIIKVSGMHCKSCEMILEEKIQEIPGVKTVSAKTSRSEVKISGDFDMKVVESVITGAGYKIGLEELGLFTRNLPIYLDFVLSLLVAAIIYMLFSVSGISKLLPSVSGGSYSYGVVILLGMTAGFSTCMALVGGLVLGFTARFREKHPEITGFKSFIPNIYFNIGRVVGFFFLGGLLGELGTLVKVSPTANGWLLLVVAFVMLVIGLQLTEISPKISKINFTIPKFISNLVPTKLSRGEYSHVGAIASGVLTFFLPCGFTQAVQLVAIASGNFLSGALLMSLFAMGTVPGLLLVGSIASFAKGSFATKLFRFMGVVVVILALLNLSASLNLIGFQLPKLSPFTATNNIDNSPQIAVVESDKQIVKMNVTANGYSPNHFTVKKGIPVSWQIDVKDISTCASYILATDMNIQQLLRRGQNTLTFTPKEVGALHFTCSMGMYSGDFTVIE
jgi:uncharacterized protein